MVFQMRSELLYVMGVYVESYNHICLVEIVVDDTRLHIAVCRFPACYTPLPSTNNLKRVQH